MNKTLQKIITETKINSTLFPMDFIFSDEIRRSKEFIKPDQEIFIEKYNQKFVKVRTSHRPISKMLISDLIVK